MIEIDGAYGEGGGQIVRTALFLSILTQKPFCIYNIRRGRPKPGLKPQHLNIVKALLDLTDSKAEGARLGSLTLKFWPGAIRGGNKRIDIGTAGSIMLFLQTLLPVSLFARNDVFLTIRGGTDVSGSMTADYFANVVIPYIKRFAQRIEFRVLKRGYYPKGGGEVTLRVIPRFRNVAGRPDFLDILRKQHPPLNLTDRGKLIKFEIFSRAWDQLKQRGVAERQLQAAKKVIVGKYRVPVREEVSYYPTLSPGTSIAIVAHFEKAILGADGLGKKGVPAEKVGEDAALALMKEIESGACVDVHLCDNLVPYIALFGGQLRTSEISSHTKTNIWISEKFLPVRFKIQDRVIKVEM